MKAERIKAGDWLLLALLGVCCVLLFLLPHLKRDAPLTAKLIVNGEVVETVSLSTLNEDVTKEIAGCEILLTQNGVRFTAADCPDRRCVKQGWLKEAGDTAACVPNRVVVTLERDDAEIDVVAY